jgi:hypothetical protein
MRDGRAEMSVYGDSPITIFEIFPCVMITIPVPHHNIQIFLWLRNHNIYVHTIYICLIYSMCFVDQYLVKCEIYKLQTLTVALFIR